jgi:hypothetical protein
MFLLPKWLLIFKVGACGASVLCGSRGAMMVRRSIQLLDVCPLPEDPPTMGNLGDTPNSRASQSNCKYTKKNGNGNQN